MFSRKDLLIAPLLQAALLFVVALAGWLTHKPLIFSSLGPTAYEMIETPERQTARPYNIIAGHLTGVAAGFLALFLARAFTAPCTSTGTVAWPRVVAAVIAASITVFITLLIRASQPAATATSLLIALGFFQHWQDAILIMAAVVLMLIPGEALRKWRLKDLAKGRQQAFWRA
jgi:CBS domain-containing membrane protein